MLQRVHDPVITYLATRVSQKPVDRIFQSCVLSRVVKQFAVCEVRGETPGPHTGDTEHRESLVAFLLLLPSYLLPPPPSLSFICQKICFALSSGINPFPLHLLVCQYGRFSMIPFVLLSDTKAFDTHAYSTRYGTAREISDARKVPTAFEKRWYPQYTREEMFLTNRKYTG